MKEWLTVIIVAVIIGVLLDGIRRMRQAKRHSIKMSLNNRDERRDDPVDTYTCELPGNGVRVAKRDDSEASELNSKLHKIIDPYRSKRSEETNSASTVSHTVAADEYDLKQPSDHEPQTATDYADRPTEAIGYQTYPEPKLELTQPEKSEKLSNVELDASPYQHSERPVEPVSESIEQKKPDTSVEKTAVKERYTPSFTATDHFDVEDDGDVLAPVRAKPVTTSKSASVRKSQTQEKTTTQAQDTEERIHEMLVIHAKSLPDALYEGPALAGVLKKQGLVYGNMNIFHAHEGHDPSAPVIYSVANMVMPGTFDLNKLDDFVTPGITLLLNLPLKNANGLEVFNQMLELSYTVTQTLGGEIKDDQRNTLTRQTAEHYRERIRDFTRKQKLQALNSRL